MALTSALYTGLSGLDVAQTRLNVIGNNIANVNTTAFKSSRVLSTPQFYVTDQSGTAPTGDFGGTNPSQEGLGTAVDSIQKDFTSGSIESTGVPTDMAIDGNGFFVVKGTQQEYTRDGSFTLNDANQLVDSSGSFVQGYGVDNDNAIIPGQLTNVTIPLGASTKAQATKNVTLEGNLNANGVVAAGSTILNSQALSLKTGATSTTLDDTALLTDVADASTPATAAFNVGDTISLSGTKGGRSESTATYTVTNTSTVGDLENFINRGVGTDTTVTGTPQPGASLQTIGGQTKLVVVGNSGTENKLEITGTGFRNQTSAQPLTFAEGTDAAGDISGATGESVHTSSVLYDSLGTPVTVDLTATLTSKTNESTTWTFYATSGDDTNLNVPGTKGSVVGDGTLTFDSTGKLTGSTGTNISIDRVGTGADPAMSVNLDFTGMTALTSNTSTMVMSRQDGSQLGTLTSYSIGADGTITGSYTNGETKTLGQMAVAVFNNPNGLQDNGGNKYSVGANSGVPVITGATQLGAGDVRQGSLELSNVDLSKEFINLITASTGFSAASRVITTSDQLITELLNSNR